MTVGTPFHPRTAAANTALQWKEWSGYLSATAYADAPDIEYNAIRNAAALIDVSPLYKYRLSGPDAVVLVDRVITRDARRLEPGRVIYTPWCDEHGHVVDDGTVARLDDGSIRWTAAEPQLRWLRLNAAGLDIEIEDLSEAVAAVALQGPLSRAVLEAAADGQATEGRAAEGGARGGPAADGHSIGRLRYFRRQSVSIAGIAVDVSRTGYTGDLGYELWVDAASAPALWDALTAAGAPYAIRAAGLLALDIVRLETGLLLLDVDYTSARAAQTPEQAYSPYEIGLGRLVDLDKPAFIGRRALIAERDAGGPRRRLVGVVLDWTRIERVAAAQGLSPAAPSVVSRSPVPVYAPRGGSQVGRVTSSGWSPILKQVIGLASIDTGSSRPGTRLDVEWTVEGRRDRVAATVVELPFLDLERKRA
ncbi:MAG TPA: aminomethyltransferase family protein [Candidatus Saccharimonadales bacterium]|nr:aminomethyltransferase family protein [Candidatus Saccharimonadales bacterium]